MSQLTGKWLFPHRLLAKVQASLYIPAVLPKSSLSYSAIDEDSYQLQY